MTAFWRKGYKSSVSRVPYWLTHCYLLAQMEMGSASATDFDKLKKYLPD